MVLGGEYKSMGGVMRLLVAGLGVLSAVAILEPAVATEIPAKPKRERVTERPAPERPAPERPAPQRPAPTQTANWSGGQLGGSNGVSSVNNNFVDPGAFVCPSGSSFGSNCFETPFQFSEHKASYTIGPFVGYRLQLGGWVVGLEGDWSWKNSESSLNQNSSTSIAVTTTTSTSIPNSSNPSGPPIISTSTSTSNFLRTDSFFGSVKQKSDYSIRGRVGWLVTPWSLLYVTGGVAFEEISGSFAYSGSLFQCSGSSPCTSSSFGVATATTATTWNDTRVGSTVGAGWESELFPGWKWRAEYRWTDFGNYTKTFGLVTSCTGSSSPTASCTSSPSSSVSINLKESFHTFRIGLAFDL
jgi:outer membrane immunogenic protein